MSDAPAAVALRGAAKAYGATPVLRDLDFDVPSASITAILGRSGSGKTTLLKMIAGLERLDAGTLSIAGRVVDDGRRALAAQHRGVGYVPQDAALFPHMTVRRNIAFGLRRGQGERVGRLLELTGLSELAERHPHELSGGQSQRVALARALAIEPALVLLDEPFSALDDALRTELRRDVARILHATATAAVLVTHDQDEAMSLADEIALLQDGQIRAQSAPRRLYREPTDARTAAALGHVNLLVARIGDGRATCALGDVEVEIDGVALAGCGQVLLRPEQLRLSLTPDGRGARAVVLDVQYHGHDALVELRVAVEEEPRVEEGPRLLARAPGGLDLTPGQDVWVAAAGAGRAWIASESPAGSRQAA
jgi:iron(III) transport system ATP-binding protein